MIKAKDAFNCRYVIDGILTGATPAQMLQECIEGIPASDIEGAETISDESLDPEPGRVLYDGSKTRTYLDALSSDRREFQLDWPENCTRQRIALSLLDAIWKDGHFSLGEIVVSPVWEWDSSRLGNMAAFYYSCSAAADYIFDLGLRLGGCSFRDSGKGCFLDCNLKYLPEEDEDKCDDIRPVFLGNSRKCPAQAVNEGKSWLIYIPFDSCPFRLGGSRLEEALGSNGDVAPDVQDSDYFIDCYEVVREMVEDGIVIAGTTVGDGGLLYAAESFCRDCGISLDISGLESSYEEKNRVRILFGEVPGVIIQIKDIDFDYVDGQLTLQDVAYYPLGHPEDSFKGAEPSSGRGAIGSILTSLLSQASEGED